MASLVKPKKNFHRQGSLDGLCGVYSIINSMDLMLSPNFDPVKTFSVLINSLGPRLARITLKGCRAPVIKKTLKTCITYLKTTNGVDIDYQKAFENNPKTLTEWWQVVSNHIDQYGAGSVVLGMSGVHDHWTCIKKITPKSIIFADSGHLTTIKRSQVTIKQNIVRRPYELIPTETFLVFKR